MGVVAAIAFFWPSRPNPAIKVISQKNRCEKHFGATSQLALANSRPPLFLFQIQERFWGF
jgi:hypothetical protein